ncbi:glycine cleavage system T protein [Batrachochytrium salamandrivorans]|nr:glycine cleavage system T protein [Batrachochytrium salamandrivorans]
MIANRTRQFSTEALKSTPLIARHQELKGKMVPFAGYNLPVFYESPNMGIMKEHFHTRAHASVFDVSHMGQVRIAGKDRVAFMERLLCADLAGLGKGDAALTLFTNELGGVIDDAIVCNAGDDLHLVVNGACKDKDFAHMEKHRQLCPDLDVQFNYVDNATLMALQGPQAMQCLMNLGVKVDFAKMKFMSGLDGVEIAGVKNCRLTRCGYTGEDGFEISVQGDESGVKVFDALLSQDFCKPCGLGARDSLRLEAGLCLYGHELDETVLPSEAGLMWVVAKARRSPQRANFLGAQNILSGAPPQRKRVGFVVEKGAPAREGSKIVDQAGNEVGVVTSGTFGPTVNKAIGMAYVPPALSTVGTKLFAQVRGKNVPISVEKMPFVAAKYFKVV